VELRQALADQDDLVVLYVMASNQINEKTLRFIEETGLRQRVRFLADPDSRAIDALGLRRPDAEPIEQGVPHPTTILLDREGRVRMIDLRADFHIWIDPSVVLDALAAIP
jgi:peroxiredoxin